jgi:hypothetical protein
MGSSFGANSDAERNAGVALIRPDRPTSTSGLENDLADQSFRSVAGTTSQTLLSHFVPKMLHGEMPNKPNKKAAKHGGLLALR